MTLLLGNIDSDTIHLIRMWFRYKILCYLQIKAHPLIQGRNTTMFATGYYTITPEATPIP